MANGRACSSLRRVADMISCSFACASALRWGAKIKPMPPPDIPPSIQKPQKSAPNSARVAAISASVKALVAAGMMAWIGPAKFRVEHARALRPRPPPAPLREQVLPGHNSQPGPDFLPLPAVDEHGAVFEPL